MVLTERTSSVHSTHERLLAITGGEGFASSMVVVISLCTHILNHCVGHFYRNHSIQPKKKKMGKPILPRRLWVLYKGVGPPHSKPIHTPFSELTCSQSIRYLGAGVSGASLALPRLSWPPAPPWGHGGWRRAPLLSPPLSSGVLGSPHPHSAKACLSFPPLAWLCQIRE